MKPLTHPENELGEIYRMMLFARTAVLRLQGKPLDPEFAHTPQNLNTLDVPHTLGLAETFLNLGIDRFNEFARAYDLPTDWWNPEKAKSRQEKALDEFERVHGLPSDWWNPDKTKNDPEKEGK